MSNPIKKRLSLEEFKEYVKVKNFGELPPTFLVIHHTYKPTKESWNGKKTIDALDNYYRRLGWGGLGPHLFIAEDGIWLFTDMYDVGIHAGAGNGTLKSGYSIGIEVVGNYDSEEWKGKTKENALAVIKILMDRLNLKNEDIRLHREFSAKSCPGWSISQAGIINQLKGDTMKEKHEKNLYKIYNQVEKTLGRDDGKNPNNRETDEIVDDLKKLVDIKPEIVYTDSKETLKKLANKKQEVIDLKMALEKRSALYKLILDAKRLLVKIWGLII